MRVKDSLKTDVKEFHDVDLPIIGLEEGTGRHQNKLGAVKVNYNGVDVRVGSGFSDEERELVWEDQASFINRVINSVIDSGIDNAINNAINTVINIINI
mgnify:CR=1 FL=1